MSPPIPLLKFRPMLLPKPWGGDGLTRVLGKGTPGATGLGESWELSDRPEAETRVDGGEYDGVGLSELIRRHGRDLLGEAAGRFPLLYKFISAREKLSVQVHPGAGSDLGEAKTECWYVVAARPGAELIVGVAGRGRSRAELLRLLQSPRCEEALRRWPARPGEVFFIPAGTVHAITEGLLLYEVQQNSDTTFRLYDWGRVDAQGRARPLHLAQAAEVADLEEHTGYAIPPLTVEKASHREDYLVACPYFALVKWHGLRGPVELETRRRFRVISVLSGSGTITAAGGAATSVSKGDTVLVPACHDAVELRGANGFEAIVSFVPQLEEEVRAPLRAAGYGEDAITALFGPTGYGAV